MTTGRTRTPRAARIAAGLAVAALAVSCLATAGTAHATEGPTYPAQPPLAPEDLAVAGDSAYTEGTIGDAGYVAEVGHGEPIKLGPGTSASQVAAVGSTVYVLGTCVYPRASRVPWYSAAGDVYPTVWTFEDGVDGLTQTGVEWRQTDEVVTVLGVDEHGRALLAGYQGIGWPRLWRAWQADGHRIKGATTRKLTLTRGLVGKRIRVVVSATMPGYEDLTLAGKRTAKVKRR
jgi:hypothetical protein